MIKKILFAGAFMLIASSQLNAMSGVTKSGYFACLKEDWLDNMVSFLVDKDEASMRQYISSQKCLSLKKGIKVSAIDYEGIGTVSFFFEGIKFWTMTEAIEK